MSLLHLTSLHGLAVLIGLLTYVVTSHIQHQRRLPSAAISWVLFILLVPYLALPLYLIFGTRKLPHARRVPIHPDRLQLGGQSKRWAIELALALNQPMPASYHALNIHAGNEAALAALLDVIDGAQHTLDICTFILGRDDLGEQIIDRLVARSRAGVEVRLLLDGVGRLLGGYPDLSTLRQAGVEVGQFVPPIHMPARGRTNLRNHRKLVIADAGFSNERLWSGGRNLAAEYFGLNRHGEKWHDLSFDLRGALTRQTANLFEHDWRFALGDAAGTPRPPFVLEAVPPDTAFLEPAAQLIASGPDQADDTVYSMLLSAIYQARERIALVSPYVVLDPALLMALTMAARRGVQVDLLLPARSNHRLADIARHRSLRALADAGAQIWMAPRMLHAKLAVFDDELAMSGSANLDGRSLFLNYELMVAFTSAEHVSRLGQWFNAERGTAAQYQPKTPSLWRDIGEGVVLWIGFQL